MITQENNVPSLGQVLDSAVIMRGLRELCKDISFDPVVNKPTEWGHVLQFPNKQALDTVQRNRIPVLYYDKYITALDRGMVPEFKQWSVTEQIMERPWADAEKEDVSIQWVTIATDHPEYMDYFAKAQRGNDPSLALMPGGSLVRRRCVGYAKVPFRVVVVGWRHTFENILNENIPGVTRRDIAAKFGVDMMKYPVGSPDELVAALCEE